jgi:hypothetical protein
MKTIINKILLASLVVLMAGCGDFLTYTKYGEPSDDNFWKTAADALSAADGLYFFMSIDGVVGRGFMHYYNCSDDVITGRTQAGCDRMKNFIADYSRDVVQNWRYMYQVIKLCNDIIVNVPGMEIDADTKNKVLGQAYFFRAWAYFWLAPYYGDDGTNGGIPIVAEGLPTEEMDVPRTASVRENYAYCIEDFKRAADLLPEFSQWPEKDWGRPHKSACWAYIAKVALWDAQYDPASYQTVVTYCDMVINSGKHSLLPEFGDVFTVANNFSSEYLFSFTSSAVAGGCILPGVFLENKGWGLYNGWGYFTPTIELVEAFEQGDKRLPVSVIQPGDRIMFLGTPKTYYSNESFSGMMIGKYLDPYKAANAIGTVVNPNGDYPTTDLNVPLMRYAEVLLMKAEALIWQGQNGDAPLNQVRARAGLPAKTGATKADLMNERRCELVGEFSHRMLDLLRWGVAEQFVEGELHGYKASPKEGIEVPQSKDDLNIERVQVWARRNFDPAVNHVFPIPTNEIAKGKNLIQNKGY